jgi:tetratricopeptide (TPR) repeat protein
MTPERWQKIEEVFHQAAELSPQARVAFLDEACATDASLRKEVETLLAQEPGQSIERAILGVAKAFSNETSAAQVGRRIGPYRLVQMIGVGGMGAVYKAVRDDDQYEKQVAVKLIKRGMDTDSILQRFRHERQILATLEHPYIARLLDGGTTEDGLPFLIMEYIDGQPIIHYCDENTRSVRERLILFRQVCEALQYAHRNLVVHRDIKPSNILVTANSIPKLLDFGIAKLLHPESSQYQMTQTIGVGGMLTPDYASPEQLRGEAVSTSTDIYSLGIVLYELLTGQRPYDFKSYSLQEIEKIITATQPEKPSSIIEHTNESRRIRKQLTGDLDNIALMALRKEPERRYSSVEQFSDDIKRHLEGRTIIARKDTVVYRAGKFVKRHKLGLAAVAMVILSLIGGIVTALYQAKRADEQAKRAENRYQQVRKLANTFLFDLHDKIQDLPGSTEAREMVAKTAVEYLDSLAKDSEDDPKLQMELAEAYQKVGDVQGNPWGPNLGHANEAKESYQKSVTMAEKVAARNSETEFLRILAAGYFKLGALQSETGDKSGSGKTLSKSLTVAETISQRSESEMDLILVGNILTRMGDVQLDTGDASGALQTYRRMLKLMEKRAMKFPSDDAQASLATAHAHVGESQAGLVDLQGAIESYGQSLFLLEPLVEKHPTNPSYLRFLRVVHTWLGHLSGNSIFINQGDTATAIQHFKKAVAISEQMTAMDPKNVRARHDLAIDNGNLADLLSDSDPARAAMLHRKALEITDELLKTSPNEFIFLVRRAYFLRGLGGDLQHLNDTRGAQEILLRAQDTYQLVTARDPSNTEVQRDEHVCLTKLGDVFMEAGDFESALKQYQQILVKAQQSTAARPSDMNAQWQLADSYSNFGNYYATIATQRKNAVPARVEAWQQARESYQRSLDIWNDWPKRAVSSIFNTTKRKKAVRDVALCDRALAGLQQK